MESDVDVFLTIICPYILMLFPVSVSDNLGFITHLITHFIALPFIK